MSALQWTITQGALSMIHVLAIITAKPGMRDRILEAFRANVEAVHAEAGCVAYEAVVDIDKPFPGFAQFGADTFVVVERWATLEALQAHAVAPHMKAYASKVKDWTADRAIHVLQAA
jgi:quinol monooxygenase YgiN